MRRTMSKKTEQQKHTTVRLPTPGPERPNLTDPRDRIRPLTKPVLLKQSSKPTTRSPSPSSNTLKTPDNLRNNNLLGRPASKCSVGLLLKPASRTFNGSQRSSPIEKDDAGTTLSATLDSIDALLMESGKCSRVLPLLQSKREYIVSYGEQIAADPIQFSNAEERKDRLDKAAGAGNSAKQHKTNPPSPSNPSKRPTDPFVRPLILQSKSRQEPTSMRVTEESEHQSAKLCQKLPANQSAKMCQKLPAVHCPELHEVFEEARSAARAGDNRRAATIFLQGIQRFGDEPTLTRLFKEACARLSVTPSLRSYPSGVLLLTATQLLIGDSLPVCYHIQPPNCSAEAPVESGKDQDLGFIALFHADFQADAEPSLALNGTLPGSRYKIGGQHCLKRPVLQARGSVYSTVLP